MTTFILIIHILVCFFLISIVLLQSGKGAELGAAFGGSSQTLFGSRGAATFLNKVTTIVAVVFMITSLTLAVISARSGSIVDKQSVTEKEKKSNIPITSGPIQNESEGANKPSQQQKQQQQIPHEPSKE